MWINWREIPYNTRGRSSTEIPVNDTLDLSQFHEVFLDEALERLAEIESLLLRLDAAPASPELLDAIFRAAHSVKGGAATFGFPDISSLTHEMETVLGSIRKGETPLSADLIDAFLMCCDALKVMLNFRLNGGWPVDVRHVRSLRHRLRAFPVIPRVLADEDSMSVLELTFGPFTKDFTAASVDGVVADLHDFGLFEESAPGTGEVRRFRMRSSVSAIDLGDVLALMLEPEQFQITPAALVAGAAAEVPSDACDAAPVRSGRDSHRSADARPGKVNSGQMVAVKGSKDASKVVPVKRAVRVAAGKIDQIVNLLGELVMNQKLLMQSAAVLDPVVFEGLHIRLGQLDQNTRDLRDAVMSMRIMPISSVFSLLQRMILDVAAKLGKEVEVVALGADIEIDKVLIERIVDPLTHLVRNGLDHGVEMPEEREAAGKPRKGRITLNASYFGGGILIEFSDDGRGLCRHRILEKARERDIPVSENMTDGDVWQLIFEPGFSTASVVNEVSGFGVGMDVVRRNILEIGGRDDVDSTTGIGTRIGIHLPLS
jgi:two-component system chemotaxis sensor kinase CheA